MHGCPNWSINSFGCHLMYLTGYNKSLNQKTILHLFRIFWAFSLASQISRKISIEQSLLLGTKFLLKENKLIAVYEYALDYSVWKEINVLHNKTLNDQELLRLKNDKQVTRYAEVDNNFKSASDEKESRIEKTQAKWEVLSSQTTIWILKYKWTKHSLYCYL